jgi:hypothetical protein
MYTDINFRTKKALRDAVAAGRQVGVYQPNGDLFNVRVPENGQVSVEGPHFPEPHRWYARVTLMNGVIVKVN